MVLAWADAGHPSADRAVRLYAAEMVDQGRDGELLVQVKAYVVKTLLRPFVPYPRGRNVVQNLMRRYLAPGGGAACRRRHRARSDSDSFHSRAVRSLFRQSRDEEEGVRSSLNERSTELIGFASK